MKKLISLALLSISNFASADIFWFVRDENGYTNWQYVANFSSGILIIVLSLLAVWLAFTRRRAQRYNRQLEEIRADLENRVIERTATLDQANVLLQQSNEALEEEIAEHRDTTSQLRMSESYINSILRSMPLMLIGLNKRGEITQWNHRAEEISGLGNAAVLGKNLWQVYPKITVTEAQIKKAEKDNKPMTIKYSQRGQYHFNITVYPLQDQKETGVVILIDDVTQQVQTANKLIQRDKMSSMGEMASVMAHDINTPLQAIMKDVQTVRQDLGHEHFDPEGLSELLEDALIRGQQASSVIRNLLAFSAGDSGEKQLASITSVMDHSIELAASVLSVTSGLRFKDVVVKKSYSDELPQLACHVPELQQVFLSLFRHACYALGKIKEADYTPTINIEITAFYDAIWVRVQHNGVGISAQDQQFIFEPFSSNNSDEGEFSAGKRLSFAHYIVTEQHQGQLAVTSDIDIGTTFHIQLPLQKEPV